MWKMGKETIPVVNGALGIIKKGLEKYVNKILGTVNINELQKLLFWEQRLSSERVCQSSELIWYLRFSHPMKGTLRIK